MLAAVRRRRMQRRPTRGMMEYYEPKKIRDIAAELRAMPKKDKPRTKAQAIEDMRAELLAAQDNGYTLTELCDFLKARGLLVSLPTLRSILQKTGGKVRKRKPNRTRPAHERAEEKENNVEAGHAPMLRQPAANSGRTTATIG